MNSELRLHQISMENAYLCFRGIGFSSVFREMDVFVTMNQDMGICDLFAAMNLAMAIQCMIRVC